MEDLINKARNRHGDLYDYSKVSSTYDGYSASIICAKHGEFKQAMRVHIEGAHCKTCSNERKSKRFRLPTSEFLRRANILHDGKYDYSKVKYNNNRDRIIIICPKHGEFEQILSGHLTGYGCRECAREASFITNEEFVRRCEIKHGRYYNYSKVNYTDSRNKVTIICPSHGEFEQTAAGHLGGSKCPKCSIEDRYLTTEQFIEKARKVHGDLYSYGDVNYVGIRTKVLITCSEHGNFSQIPNSHLYGAGCFKCNASKGELAVERILINENIKHIREYTLPEIVNRYRYDFYLPEYRALIEFHGIQHYESVELFGGEEVFDYTRRNDEIKRLLASEAKYVLIELNYKQLETLSSEEFKKLLLKKLAKINKR